MRRSGISTAASERFPCSSRRKPKSLRRRNRPEAIADAKNNAKINEIENAEFFVGKSEEILPAYYEQYAKDHPGEHAHADVIVVDPPRKGCEENLLHTMASMQPDRIVYVSCDSATLARDGK